MKSNLCIAILATAMLLTTPAARAQDEPKREPAVRHEEAFKGVTPLRVQVVFMEFDGEKKISNLPYVLMVNSDEKGPRAALRMGLRVPIATGGSAENRQFTYLDVGTNIDGNATATDDGRFALQLNVERSTIYGLDNDKKLPPYENSRVSDATPIVVSFRSQVNLVLRDGQTMQTTVATDPLTGRVLKVEVTLGVLKKS
jgi:hypothetical protein